MEQLKKAISDVDYVYHLAALSNINKVIENPVKAVDFNILGTTKILEACRLSPQIKRVIYASSYFVNSGKGHLYTTTKEISEIICKNYYNMYGIPFTILRYGTIYGPRSRGEDVISIFVKRAIENKPLIIHGDGNQLRNFIYVEDAADGSYTVLQDKAKNKIYNIIGKQQTTINEIIEMMKKLFGDIKIKYEKERFDDYKGFKFLNEIDEIEKDFCWKPKINIEEGIKKYIEWFKKKKHIL